MMWLDGEKNPNGTYRENRNIVATKDKGKLANEKGFSKIAELGKVIGVIELNNNDSVHFFNDGRLLYLKNDEITTIRTNLKKTNNPIHGVFHLNNKGERIIYWTDEELQVLNIDSVENNYNAINTSNVPVVYSEVKEEGSLQSGAYYPIVQLIKKDKSATQWYKHYNPISITDGIFNNSYESFNGIKSGVLTNKSIQIYVHNVDQTFDKVRIGYVFQKEGIREAYFVHEIEINSNIVSYKINGSETKQAITLDEVVVDPIKYNKVGLLTTFQNSLYIGDLSIREEPNQQSFSSNYTIDWYSESFPVIDNKVVEHTPTKVTIEPNKSKFSHKYQQFYIDRKTFLHGEVYAFYISYEYTWGIGKWWHIPGRLSIPTELLPVTLIADALKRFQLYDTVTLLGDKGAGKYGKMGYWENEELYPVDKGFPIGRVRHHMFPTHKWMKGNIYPDEGYGTKYLDLLGFIINNVNLNDIKDNDGNKAIGYRIGYAKRDISNRVLGQSIVVKNTNDNDYIASVGGNISIDTSPVPITFASKLVRTYPFEILQTENDVNVTHIRPEYELYNFQYRGMLVNFSADKGVTIAGVNDYTIFGKSYITPNPIQKVVNSFIVANNAIPKTSVENNAFKNDESKLLNNTYLEKFYSVETVNNYNIKITQGPLYLTDGLLAAFKPVEIEEYTELVTLLNIQKNYYTNLWDRSIVNCGNKVSNIFFGGDGYICDYSVNVYGVLHKDYTTELETPGMLNSSVNGLRFVKRFLCESVYNINLRYEDQSNYYPSSTPFNKTKTGYLQSIKTDVDPNIGGYNKDFNALNDLEAPEIYDPYDTFIKDYPFIVAKSDPYNRDNAIEAWRTFRPNNYKQLTRERGVMKNLESGQDFIFIHFEKTLLKTRGNEQLRTEGLSIFVGYGDIFEHEPIEVIHDKLGSLGTQHKWSCKYTNLGYIFLDAEKKKLFVVNNSIEVLSDRGLHEFFQQNSSCNYDNPFIGFGFNLVYDEQYNRILLSKKNQKLKPEDELNFKGIWKDVDEFLSSLQTGDIVLRDGKYIRYVGNI